MWNQVKCSIKHDRPDQRWNTQSVALTHSINFCMHLTIKKFKSGNYEDIYAATKNMSALLSTMSLTTYSVLYGRGSFMYVIKNSIKNTNTNIITWNQTLYRSQFGPALPHTGLCVITVDFTVSKRRTRTDRLPLKHYKTYELEKIILL